MLYVATFGTEKQVEWYYGRFLIYILEVLKPNF